MALETQNLPFSVTPSEAKSEPNRDDRCPKNMPELKKAL